MGIRKKLKEKLKEALQAVLPIIGLVLLLSFTIAPISPSILLCFLIGGILLIAGNRIFHARRGACNVPDGRTGPARR